MNSDNNDNSISNNYGNLLSNQEVYIGTLFTYAFNPITRKLMSYWVLKCPLCKAEIPSFVDCDKFIEGSDYISLNCIQCNNGVIFTRIHPDFTNLTKDE